MDKKSVRMACGMVLDQAESEVKKSEELPIDGTIDGLSLLLAEDNELNAEIAELQLKEAGADVTIVRDGQQAVDLFIEKPEGTFDAILMDIMMPVMDGLSATRVIRSLDREDAKTIPIIAMTANAFVEDARRSMEAGMNAHLVKPLDMKKEKEQLIINSLLTRYIKHGWMYIPVLI